MTDVARFESTGGGARRTIAWDALDAGRLGDAGRRAVGATWLERTRQEHLAVGAFSLLARELAAAGCDPVVLALVTRAACDEVRHAAICRRFAVALLGEGAVPGGFRGLPKVPMHAGASAGDRVLFHVVEMCCMSETLTGVYFTEMLARTTDPVAREAVESLLEDEIDHGRVGWAYLAGRARDGALGGLAAALPAMLARTFAPVLDAKPRRRGAAAPTRDDGASAPGRPHDADDPCLEACAYLGPRAGADVYRRALRDVILPGFEALGVDLAAARALVRDRGWA
ncbi:MAG TPA: ferritin-like domain-containing protein [Polyangiaceae bacterium]